MSKLTIKQRADRFLEHGVNHPEKWAAVHDYKEPEGTVRSWKKEYERLRKHHLEETYFLFDLLRELGYRINPPPPPPKVGDKVRVPWWEGWESQRVPDLEGYIESIDGGYHYIKVTNNKKYDVIELYENEFEVLR